MVTLVVIDHHRSDYLDKSHVEIPTFASEDEFITAVARHVQNDYDLLLSDADPDGYLSALIFALSKGTRGAQYQYRCYRVPLTKEIIDIFHNNGITTIIAFDWFPIYACDLSIFDRVVLLNPTYSKLFEHTSTSELVYRALAHKTDFMEDLNAIGVVCDYGVQSGAKTIERTIARYPKIFASLLEPAQTGKLNRYNVYESPFSELTEMYWAPYIVNGERGAQELVSLILANEPFTFADLFNYSHHPVVKYIRGMHAKLSEMLRSEQGRYHDKKIENGAVIIYEPAVNSPGFVQKFSSMLCQHTIGKVFMIKTKINGNTKYSVRHRGLHLDLGRILHEMGVGGGHPEAAGALVKDPEGFELAFIERVKNELNA